MIVLPPFILNHKEWSTSVSAKARVEQYWVVAMSVRILCRLLVGTDVCDDVERPARPFSSSRSVSSRTAMVDACCDDAIIMPNRSLDSVADDDNGMDCGVVVV